MNSAQASIRLKNKLNTINKRVELALNSEQTIETGFELRDFIGEDAHVYKLYLNCIDKRIKDSNKIYNALIYQDNFFQQFISLSTSYLKPHFLDHQDKHS